MTRINTTNTPATSASGSRRTWSFRALRDHHQRPVALVEADRSRARPHPVIRDGDLLVLIRSVTENPQPEALIDQRQPRLVLGDLLVDDRQDARPNGLLKRRRLPVVGDWRSGKVQGQGQGRERGEAEHGESLQEVALGPTAFFA
jgi:hypothetical protein